MLYIIIIISWDDKVKHKPHDYKLETVSLGPNVVAAEYRESSLLITCNTLQQVCVAVGYLVMS
jgi:hypothetical protein